MCGIAGIIGNNQPGFSIEKMLERISYRGPNGLFYWKNKNGAFGHARLSIIDLSSDANQPMTDDTTGNTIIFNGEIYNYIEIKKAIGSRYEFKTNSDTEVILAAYKIYGQDFLTHLRGMFSFALFDNTTNKVLVVRDRFGIKPFYYRKINGTFLFASEIKALLKINNEPEEINENKAYDFIADCQLDCDDETMFGNIFQLLPAHCMWVSMDGSTSSPKEYWCFPEPGVKHFDASSGNEFVSIFNDTVRLHLRSDVPVGCFLSGGIDSSSVACFAAENMGESMLHTFSAVLPYFHPENVLIDDVLKKSNRFIPHKFLLDGDNYFDDIFSVIYHHDEPIMDGSMYAHYKLCSLARDHGIKVLLSGSGGDELFGGYASHIHAYHAKLLSQLRLVSWINAVKKVRKHSAIGYKALFSKSVYETLPVGVRRAFKHRQLQKRINHVSSSYALKHYYHTGDDAFSSNMINSYKSWTAPPFLHYEDRNCMAFGVEARVPFFDHELVEFVLQFRADDIVQGKSKSILRNSFRGRVPQEVLDQKGKYGFPSPIDHALRNDNYGKEIFFDLYKETPLLKQQETEKLARDFYEKSGDVSIFWRTFSYILWYHIFFKGLKNMI
ncbi:MAG: asparagine synthase (glutamine-hydrolyzing) [Ginsengibacter sp.]